ncbi:MAG: alpha/beta hydrolase [Proteobacteria bacterium]|nr:alpha/beta hydrolase [Pseudomonadota bacterium]
MQNLRFGELTMEIDDNEVQRYLTGDRQGDGENLSEYFTNLANEAEIRAYKDSTHSAKKIIPAEHNASTKAFLNLKNKMKNAADVLVYIHGYNVSWEQSVGAALALQTMLDRNSKDDPNRTGVIVVLFSWPSDGSMMPFSAYNSDRCDAEGSGHAVGRAMLKLRDFLHTLKKDTDKEEEKLCGQELHLLCHSMGNYVLQNALVKMIKHSEGDKLPRIFDHIFLCAPDVDDDVLDSDQPMRQLHQLCRKVTVYCNKEDIAMFISDVTKGNPDRLGHSGIANPLKVHGKIHEVDCTPVVSGIVEHSYYLWGIVNDDIRFSVEGMDFDDNSRSRRRGSNTNTWVMVK